MFISEMFSDADFGLALFTECIYSTIILVLGQTVLQILMKTGWVGLRLSYNTKSKFEYTLQTQLFRLISLNQSQVRFCGSKYKKPLNDCRQFALLIFSGNGIFYRKMTSRPVSVRDRILNDAIRSKKSDTDAKKPFDKIWKVMMTALCNVWHSIC